MATTVEEITRAFEEWTPNTLAEDWDNVGLQLGSLKAKVKKLGFALDLTPQTLSQAISYGLDCLVTHHPFLFKSIKNICWDSWPGSAIKTLCEKNISLISLHTNLDAAQEGVSDILAKLLHLKVERAILPSKGAAKYLVSLYVPKGYEEKIRQILLEEKTSFRGKYYACSFAVEGKGSFFPEEDAKPFVGESGKLNVVPETKLEFLVPGYQLPKIISKIKEIHPYEEVPFDVLPLETRDAKVGLGRVGLLPLEITLRELALKVSEVLQSKAVFMVGDPQKLVRKVALCAGAGGELFKRAYDRGAEVYITAEVKYHQAREAETLGLSLISCGHFESEIFIVPQMAEFIKSWAAARDLDLEVFVLKEKSPFLPVF
ncbi:Nif3-like dinuclear metal center hexameric protein [Thermodesulfatator atlanticus]|uniref:Nif3-like dinuclear metal center hexameric protein n=1 Tax=Thermodesulfatator atlanticus TaxID=501497 RepID=UPI0003B760D2|nr:Nif3-like dinuclear metal center hexameric protein [Thermodesulfatator atlanticus]